MQPNLAGGSEWVLDKTISPLNLLNKQPFIRESKGLEYIRSHVERESGGRCEQWKVWGLEMTFVPVSYDFLEMLPLPRHAVFVLWTAGARVQRWTDCPQSGA